MPDEARINYPKAVAELNDGFAPSPRLAEEIRDFCRGSLPEYMVPQEVDFIDALPRTSRGKVDYRALERRETEEMNHD